MIDNHFQKIVKLHFDDEMGAPFWIDKKTELSFDPLNDIEEVDDLILFEEDEVYNEFPQEELKTNWRNLVPQKFDNNEFRVYSSGGRTGKPKWTAWVTEGGAWNRLRDCISEKFDERGISRGRDFAYLGPTGPHPFGYMPRELAHHRNGQFLTIDMDPRWVRKVKTNPELQESGVAGAYIDHMKSQTRDLLEQHGENIGVLISTPSVIGMMHGSGVLDRLDLDGVVFAGQAMKGENYQVLDQVLDAELMGWYGNTVNGIALQEGFDKDSNLIVYQPEETLAAAYDILEPESVENGEFKQVDYGDRGQTVTHIIREGLFAPYFVEDDEATRLEPSNDHSFDALGSPDVLSSKQDEVEAGVY